MSKIQILEENHDPKNTQLLVTISEEDQQTISGGVWIHVIYDDGDEIICDDCAEGKTSTENSLGLRY